MPAAVRVLTAVCQPEWLTAALGRGHCGRGFLQSSLRGVECFWSVLLSTSPFCFPGIGIRAWSCFRACWLTDRMRTFSHGLTSQVGKSRQNLAPSLLRERWEKIGSLDSRRCFLCRCHICPTRRRPSRCVRWQGVFSANRICASSQDRLVGARLKSGS